MILDLIKRDPNIIKTVIFEIAMNNDVAISDIVKNTTLNYQTVKNQINFLSDSGLLEQGRTTKDIKRGKGHEIGDSIKSVKFNPNIQTFQDIAKILDNKELSRFMASKYYQDNIKDYLTNLINSMEQNKLYQLPEIDYFEYALRNSPSTVRFFLIDHDINLLIFFHKRGISTIMKGIKNFFPNKNNEEDIIKPEERDGFVNLFWDQAIYGKIQEDVIKNSLLNPNDDFADYYPLMNKAISMMGDLSLSKRILNMMLDAIERKK